MYNGLILCPESEVKIMPKEGDPRKGIQRPVSRLDSLLPESQALSASERLTAKLELIMQDPDLNLQLGGILSQLIVPGQVEQGTLSQEQAGRVYNAIIDRTLDAMLTPEQREQAEIDARSRSRQKLSPFSGW